MDRSYQVGQKSWASSPSLHSPSTLAQRGFENHSAHAFMSYPNASSTHPQLPDGRFGYVEWRKRQSTEDGMSLQRDITHHMCECLCKGHMCDGVHSTVQLWARARHHGFGQSGTWSQGQGTT